VVQIRAERLVVKYGTFEVLRDLDMDFLKSETTAIMGTSGGGKTTLLRCLAGLQRVNSGKIIFDGEDITKLSEDKLLPFRRRIGFVFQYAALFDYLTVRQNVEFGAIRLRRLPKVELKERVDRMLKLVGLEDKGDLMPSELSGGMRKRVGIARALATDPEVLFYDEPTSGLDPVTAYAIDSLISEMKEELRVTSIVVSHDVNSVFRTADTISVIADGHIVEKGNKQDILASKQPAVMELLKAYQAASLG